MQSHSLPTTILTQPDLYPVEFKNREILFAQMNRESYFNSLFLDCERIKSTQPPTTLISIDALIKEINNNEPVINPVNFIFHTANCGSTLLSRALDIPNQTLAYREPFTLRQLGIAYTSLKASNSDLKQWLLRLKLTAFLLSRQFSKNETPLIKANIPVNFMLPPLLSMFQASRGLLLYSDLESFLISALKLPQRRLWIEGVAKSLTGVLEPLPGASIFNTNEHFVPKMAASVWVAQMQQLQEVSYHHKGLRSLTSDQFFNETNTVLTSAAEHLQINLSVQEISKIVESDLFKKYSKNPNIKYNADKRLAERQSHIKVLGPEIADGMQWGESLMKKYNVSSTIKNSLI